VKILSFIYELFSFFSVYIITLWTALSSRAMNGHQMYSGSSVISKCSTILPEILLTPF